MNFKSIILEGADCCGKTSFAKELYSKEKNAIWVHFPRMVDGHLKSVIKNLTNTLYNPYFIKKFKAYGNFNFNECGSSFHTVNIMLIDNMLRNITYNAENKYEFLKYLIKIKENQINYRNATESQSLKKTYFELIIIAFNNILESGIVDAKINNKKITDPELPVDSKKRLIKNLIESDKDFVIIFDRFFMSGDVYNYSVPINVYLNYIKEIKKDFIDYINNYYESISDKNTGKQIIHDMKYYEDNYIIEKINKLRDEQIVATSRIINECNYIFNNNVKTSYCDSNLELLINDKYLLDPTNIVHIIFRTNKKLVEYSKKDKNRKFDDYDKNNDIQTISRKVFDLYEKGPNAIEKEIRENDFKILYNEYYIKSILIDSNEYLIFENGKVKADKTKLKYTIEKIDILHDCAVKGMNHYLELKNITMKNLLKDMIKVSKTENIGIEEI